MRITISGRPVAAMDSCFALIGVLQHGIAVGPLYGQSRSQRPATVEENAA